MWFFFKDHSNSCFSGWSFGGGGLNHRAISDGEALSDVTGIWGKDKNSLPWKCSQIQLYTWSPPLPPLLLSPAAIWLPLVFFPEGERTELGISTGGKEVKGKFPSLSRFKAKHLQNHQNFLNAKSDGFLAWLQMLLCQMRLGLFTLPWVELLFPWSSTLLLEPQRWGERKAKAKLSCHILVNIYWANTMCSVLCYMQNWANLTQPLPSRT